MTTFKLRSQTPKINIDPLIRNYFSLENGFGPTKPLAIKLLKNVTELLDNHQIPYFLISGTLLGYVRHRDFIPWDDDIDLIVDGTTFLAKIEEISAIFRLTLIKHSEALYKICYKNQGTPISGNYLFPFVDLFPYYEDTDSLTFFGKAWDKTKFFPAIPTTFLGIPVNIPHDPLYFLYRNFGEDCLINAVSGWSHRENKILYRPIKVKLSSVMKYLLPSEANSESKKTSFV